MHFRIALMSSSYSTVFWSKIPVQPFSWFLRCSVCCSQVVIEEQLSHLECETTAAAVATAAVLFVAQIQKVQIIWKTIIQLYIV